MLLTDISVRNKILMYLVNIAVACLFTSALNILHTKYVLHIPLTPSAFIAPLVAGILFGCLLARIMLLHEAMSRIAHIDSLTNIYNRLHFQQFLDAEIDRVKRYGSTFSLIFFDLDNFKDINDKYGHLVGDEVLVEVARLVQKANRSADIFARYGGEEFIILTPATDIRGAGLHAERLLTDINTCNFDTVGRVTCSFGIAEFKPETDDVTSVLLRADTALYQAKRNGRNNVVKGLA
jgi:diguanylate cyclase (GGDEF)-like protein